MFHGMRFSLFEDTDMENDFVNLGQGCHVQFFLDPAELNDCGFPEKDHRVLVALV